MNILDFKNLLGLDALKEIDRANYIAFYLIKEENQVNFSISKLVEKYKEFGYSQPNSSRLKANLIKNKIVKNEKSRNRSLEFIPVVLEELEKDCGNNWKDIETIPSDSELLDEVKFCGKRTFLTQLIKQINATYGSNCYDACAILLRRLFEIMLVLCFEKYNIADEIKKTDGSYKMLEGITNAAIANKTLNISKRITDNFQSFREVGNNSAHSITYIASKKDIDDIKTKYRVMLEDLYNKAGII